MTAKRKRTARELTIWAIHRGETNAEIARRVKLAHPKSPLVTPATVNYIRNEIRKADKSVRSDRTIRRGR